MRLTNLALLLPLSVTALTACGGDCIEIEGTYSTTANWDLSAPFGRDGIGGAFADLLIEETVSTAVPGLIEAEAIDVASAALRSPIKGVVEQRLPPELREGGEVLIGIRDLLGSVEVETEYVFTDDVEGSERVKRFRFMNSSTSFELSESQLPPGIEVAADIEGGREEADLVELDDYNLEIRFGDFILILVDEVLLRDSVALTNQTKDSIPCQVVVEEITGGDGSFDLRVAGQNISISAGALESACNAVRNALGEYALGLAKLDSGVQLNGQVKLYDDDGDNKADRLSSQGPFEGRITLLPGPFEPKFDATFTATRVQ